MKRTTLNWRLVSILLCGLVLVSNCGSPRKERTVTVAYVPAAYYLPFLVMESDGLLEKRGYALKLQQYKDNAEMISAFLNGQLDVTAQSAFTMFPVEAEHPGMFKFVYGQYANSYAFMVPGSSSIRNLSELRGLTIGTWRSPTAEAFIRIVLRRRGVSDSDYTIQRFGATEWAPALENGVVPVVFGFDVPLAVLQSKGSFRYVEERAVPDLLQPAKVFNGGAFVSTRLIAEDPGKARAIRDALLEAVQTIRSNPDKVAAVLSEKLGAPVAVAPSVLLDRFGWPNDEMVQSAVRTLELLTDQGLVRAKIDVYRLFWRD